MTYCEFVRQKAEDDVHKIYHDTEYGFPINNDNELFGRLILEINQAGLSWTTILKKKEGFRKAYANFEIPKVASFTEEDRARLLSDAGIIRNKLKVNAAIVNAQRIVEIQKEFGSFQNWLDEHHPKTKDEWVKLFKKNFKFVGGEIVNEFLMSSGYLKGAHDDDCPIQQKVLAQKPKWTQV
ncbi:DNA-3-methyladenine glycosylase [marine bacterium AO1-C]|nr:DNA-3-methyladenine glycosylase [marine bacterium AO1-C]